MVLPKHRAVVLVHGCFWHAHDCHLFRWPKTRENFWREKIGSNAARDRKQLAELRDAGWRVAIIWECALKGRYRLLPGAVADACARWLESSEQELELSGNETRPIA